MSQLFVRRDAVAYKLLELFDVGKAAGLFAGPDPFTATSNVPPVEGARATLPSSCSKVVKSSCAIQAARSIQRH